MKNSWYKDKPIYTCQRKLITCAIPTFNPDLRHTNPPFTNEKI